MEYTIGYDGEIISLGQKVRVISNINHKMAGQLGVIAEVDEDQDVIITFLNDEVGYFFKGTFSSKC